MWRMTTSLNGWNFVRYLLIILLTNTAHLCLRRSKLAWSGSRSSNCNSLRDFLGLFVSNSTSLTRFRTAYCWVQWIERLLLSTLWILALIIKSILSPTNLEFWKKKWNFTCFFKDYKFCLLRWLIIVIFLDNSRRKKI